MKLLGSQNQGPSSMVVYSALPPTRSAQPAVNFAQTFPGNIWGRHGNERMECSWFWGLGLQSIIQVSSRLLHYEKWNAWRITKNVPNNMVCSGTFRNTGVFQSCYTSFPSTSLRAVYVGTPCPFPCSGHHWRGARRNLARAMTIKTMK